MWERHPGATTRSERLLRLFGLYLLVPLLLVLEIPVIIHIAQCPTTGMTIHNLVVQSVAPGSPAAAAKVEPGDHILAIDGIRIETTVDYYLAVSGRYDLSTRIYSLEGASGRRDTAIGATRPPRARIIWGYATSVAGLAFLLMGWLVFSRRTDVVARYFFWLCTVFAFFLMDIPDWPSPVYMHLKEILRDLANLLLPLLFLRFFLYFPSRVKLDGRTRRRHRLLAMPVAPLFAISLYAHAARLDPATSPLVMTLQALASFYFLAYFVAGLVIFAMKAIRRRHPVERSKLRLVLIGLALGLVPFLAGSVLHNLSPAQAVPYQEWLGFSLILVPLSFGLAILRYGALDMAYVLRHSLIYGALTVVIAAGYGLIVGLIGHELTRVFHISSTPLVLLAVLASALAANPIRQWLLHWTEDRFYPARRATRSAIQDLCQELAGMTGVNEAARTIVDRMASFYRPRRVALMLAENGGLRLAHEQGDGVPPVAGDQYLRADQPLIKLLTAANRPFFTEELEQADATITGDRIIAGLLADLDVQLFVPLITHNRICGLLTLGSKSDGALYSQTDVGNLSYFGQQAAALLEILRLYRDNMDRERLETELTLAKQIQENLVPTAPLKLPGADLCGRMDSCREVGGDYFDYFPLDSETVGFAIADAAGKGIPAALVMTTLRVAFRSIAARHREPQAVVERLNDTICSLATMGHFISFFYGVYDIPTRTLHYCNAGMNRPLLLRAGRAWAEPLKKGGLVLGIKESQHYAWGTLSLQPTDRLILYTDGLTEETDSHGEFYGEDRLEESARLYSDKSPEDLRDAIFDSVERFGGATQSDDRTLMLLQVNELEDSGRFRHFSG